MTRLYYKGRRCHANKVWIVCQGVKRACVEFVVPGKPLFYLLDIYGRTWEAVSLYKGDVNRVAYDHRLELRPDAFTEVSIRNE